MRRPNTALIPRSQLRENLSKLTLYAVRIIYARRHPTFLVGNCRDPLDVRRSDELMSCQRLPGIKRR